MEIGDPFVRHTAYCFQVLEGLRPGEFNDAGLWPASSPAEVDEPSQQVLLGQFMRWKELVKKYAAVSKLLDPRELFILAVFIQRYPGPVLEFGTHKGITTCFVSEVQNTLKRRDHLFTIELFLESYKGHSDEDGFPGEGFLKAIQQFRRQPALQRVVPIIGDSHELKPLIWGIRPDVLFFDGDCTAKGIADDLSVLKFFNHNFTAVIHNANMNQVMEAVLDIRVEMGYRFVNFHTGGNGEKGMIALVPN